LLQRGRKGQLAREVIPLRSAIIADRLSRELPPAPERLDQPEKATWNAILREHDLNHAGRLLLEMGLRSIGRARACRGVIDRDGGDFVTGRRGLPRPHPLVSTEIRLLQTARQVFKMLKINLRGEEF
jgi:hypothetical protein